MPLIPKCSDQKGTSSSISSDNAQGGKLAAQTMAKLAGGKSGSVLVLDTKAGTSVDVGLTCGIGEHALGASTDEDRRAGLLHGLRRARPGGLP